MGEVLQFPTARKREAVQRQMNRVVVDHPELVEAAASPFYAEFAQLLAEGNLWMGQVLNEPNRDYLDGAINYRMQTSEDLDTVYFWIGGSVLMPQDPEAKPTDAMIRVTRSKFDLVDLRGTEQRTQVALQRLNVWMQEFTMWTDEQKLGIWPCSILAAFIPQFFAKGTYPCQVAHYRLGIPQVDKSFEFVMQSAQRGYEYRIEVKLEHAIVPEEKA